MRLRSISPLGVMATFNLDLLPVWRLELAAVGASLVLGLRYLAPGPSGQALGIVVALDTGVISDADKAAVLNIAKVGFPKHTLDEDRARLLEAAKLLHNCADLKASQADELVKDAALLADHYHKIKAAVEVGGADSGEYRGWSWSVLA